MSFTDETSFKLVVPSFTVFTLLAPSKELCDQFYRDALDALQAFKTSSNNNATPRTN